MALFNIVLELNGGPFCVNNLISLLCESILEEVLIWMLNENIYYAFVLVSSVRTMRGSEQHLGKASLHGASWRHFI